MTSTSDRTDDDALVEQWYDDEERTILLRYLRLSKGEEFSLAAAEVPGPAVRMALLRWLRARVPDRPLIEVSLKRLAGVVLVDEIAEAIAQSGPCPPHAVIVLTDLESVRGAATDSHPSLFMRLNVERDPLVQALPYACLLLAHPAALLKLSTVAPDFSHFFSTRIHHRKPAEAAPLGRAAAPISFGPSPSAQLGLSDSDWPTLLRAADHALTRSEYDRARDCLSEFRATPEVTAWEAECRLLEGAVDGATKGARAGLTALAGLNPDNPALRPALVVRLLLKQSELHNTLGERQASEAQLDAAQHVADRVGRRDLHAAVLTHRASRVAMNGAIEEALALLEQARAIYEACGRTREAWDVVFLVAQLRSIRGEWDTTLALCEQVLLPMARTSLHDDRLVALVRGLQANILALRGSVDVALRVRREEQLPIFERCGDVRERAITLGNIADLLESRGDLDNAFRIRREEELPVYERLGDVRSRAITLGKIADLLQSRGDIDEALRIRRDEELPVYDRLGDVRARAITLGRIADVLESRGDLDDALLIRRESELPVYERLGDVHSRAVTLGKIADIQQSRGYLDEALRVRRSEELPVYNRLGDVRSRAITLGKIADVLQSRDQLDEALRIRREEQLPVYVRLGDVRGHAFTLSKIADVLQRQGAFDDALRIFREEVLPVYERLGDVRSRAMTLGQIAGVLQRKGDLNEALRICRDDLLPVYLGLGLRHEAAITIANVGSLLSRLGQHHEAISSLKQARGTLDQLGLISGQIHARLALASALWRARNVQDAIFEAQAALTEAEAIREPAFLVQAVEHLVPLLLTQRRVHEAREVHARAATILAEDGRWQALKQLDALLPQIERVTASPQPTRPAKARRR